MYFCRFFHETYEDFEVFEIITKIDYYYILFFQIPKKNLYFFQMLKTNYFLTLSFYSLVL